MNMKIRDLLPCQEIKRTVIQKSCAFIMAFLVLCSAALCPVLDNVGRYKGSSFSDYSAISLRLLSLPENARDQFLADCQDTMDNPAALNAVAQDYHAVRDYASYLDEIQKQAKGMNILGSLSKQKDYRLKAIQKTADDYASLRDVIPVFDQNTAILFLDESNIVAWLGIIGSLLFCLIIHTRERTFFPLYHVSRNGRKSLYRAKLFTLLAYTSLTSVCMFGLCLAYACARYGFGDLLRPIQSACTTCPLKISVAEYLLMRFLLFQAGQWFNALVCYVICRLFKTVASAAGAFFLYLGLGFSLSVIPASDSLYGLLHYLNPVSIMDLGTVFREYHLVNLFDTPVVFPLVACIWVIVWIGFLIFLGIRMPDNDKCRRSVRPFHSPVQFKEKNSGSVSLLQLECWRFCIGRGVLVLFLMSVGVLLIRSVWFPVQVSDHSNLLRGIIEQASYDKSPVEWITREQVRVMSSERQMPAYSLALDDALLRAEYIEQQPAPGCRLLFSDGYSEMFVGKTNLITTLILVLFITVFSILAAPEDADALFSVLPQYRKRKRFQIFLFRPGTLILVFCIAAGIDIAQINVAFSLPDLAACAASLPSLNQYAAFSILGWIILAQSIRLLSFLAVSSLLINLAKHNTWLSLTLSLIFLVFPLLLETLGIRMLTLWPFSRLLRGTILLFQ